MTAPPPVPALPDTQRLTSYSISAQTGPFNVNFAIYGDGGDYGNWIEVWLNDVQQTAVTNFVLSSPTGPITAIARPISDAQVTLTTAGTGTLVIIGARRPRRTTQFSENVGVAARDLNQALTDIFADQREGWDFARTRQLYFPGGETVTPTQFPIAAARANRFLSFDGSGNPSLLAATISGTAAVTLLSTTRALFSTVTMPSNTVMLSGYATAGDLGAGAVYTSVGAGPSSLLAIQDSSAVWFGLVVNGPLNVGWFGAKGNGIADDTTAINSAIAAFNSAGIGVLYFPAGTYLVSSALTAITATGLIRGDGMGAASGYAGDINTVAKPTSTVINCSSQTAVLFTVNGWALTFQDISLVNTFGGTPTSASAGIVVTSSNMDSRINYERVYVAGFYIGIDVQVASNWFMNGCLFFNAVLYNIKINNTVNPDAGDWTITNSSFYGGSTHTATDAIHIIGSGGGKITNCKINSATTDCVNGINASLLGSSNLQIANCSIENVTTSAVVCTNVTNLTIVNLEILNRSSSDQINLTSCSNVTISNIVGTSTGTPYVLSFSSTNNVLLGPIIFTGSMSGIINPAHFPTTWGNIVDGGAISAQFLSGQNNGFYVLLNTDTNNRIGLDLDGTDHPRLGFGPGGVVDRDTFLNRQGANIFGVGSSGTAKDGTLIAAAFETSTALVATGGGGATPAFAANSTGGAGQPTTAAQNGWVKMLDSTGATIWLPVWK
jgi:hypothetical protein